MDQQKQKSDDNLVEFVRHELKGFREEAQQIRGAMLSISQDINATSKSAEHNAAIVAEVLLRMNSLDDFVKKFSSAFQKIVNRHEEQIRALHSAFPDGDLESHRNYHKDQNDWRKLRNDVVRELFKKAVATGGIAGGVWLLWAVWKAIKISVMQ